MKKEFDKLMLMNDSFLSQSSLSSKQLSDNYNQPDLQKVLISKTCICQMIRMRINKLTVKMRDVKILITKGNFQEQRCFSNYNCKGII